jgi:hypothetical protein
MNLLTDREKRDVQKIAENSNHCSSLPERHRTASVSMAAVLASGHNPEYVPETVINKEICRAALNSEGCNSNCLKHIWEPDYVSRITGNLSGGGVSKKAVFRRCDCEIRSKKQSGVPAWIASPCGFAMTGRLAC